MRRGCKSSCARRSNRRNRRVLAALRRPTWRAPLTPVLAHQLELEGRTRAELEDVLQRIERHFRGEQAVRRRAEDAEREATQEMEHEREMRVRLEEEARAGSDPLRRRVHVSSRVSRPHAAPQLRLRGAETRETDALRASLEAEHAAVEEDCKRVEQELGVARSEARGVLTAVLPHAFDAPVPLARARAGEESTCHAGKG